MMPDRFAPMRRKLGQAIIRIALAGLVIAAFGFVLGLTAAAETIGPERPVYRSVDPRTSARRPRLPRKASVSVSRDCLPKSLKRHLAYVEKRYGGIRIVSTFRKGAVIAGSGSPSLHASCRAVDFHPAPGTYKAVLAYLKKNHDGGLGTYSCGMHHLHVDNGEKVRWHHCVNSRGVPVK